MTNEINESENNNDKIIIGGQILECVNDKKTVENDLNNNNRNKTPLFRIGFILFISQLIAAPFFFKMACGSMINASFAAAAISFIGYIMILLSKDKVDKVIITGIFIVILFINIASMH